MNWMPIGIPSTRPQGTESAGRPRQVARRDHRSRGPGTASAAWSPDGKWMYFGVEVQGQRHLWRQRFMNGKPEQLTFGATEEDGVAVAPTDVR